MSPSPSTSASLVPARPIQCGRPFSHILGFRPINYSLHSIYAGEPPSSTCCPFFNPVNVLATFDIKISDFHIFLHVHNILNFSNALEYPKLP